MFNCCFCTFSGNSIPVLFAHLRINHKHSNSFKCKQDQCLRLFSDSTSFRRHIKLNHVRSGHISANKGAKKGVFILEADDENGNDIETEAELIENNDFDGNNVDKKKAYDFQKETLNFVTKLYGKPQITRKTVHEVIQLTSNLIFYLCEGLKNDLSLLEGLSEENKKKMLHSIENIENPFEMLKT